MKIISLTIIILFFCTHAFSQYKEGFIITNENDTIHGLIDFEGSMVNCSHCLFKKDLTSDQIEYNPGSIKGFRFIGSKYFISKDILIEDQLKTVFLEWLIKGKANILSYVSHGLDTRYFIMLDNDSIHELKNSTIQREIDGSSYEINKKEYINDLRYYFKDCPQLYNSLEALPYSSSSLIKVSKKYHEITCGDNNCIIFEDKNRKSIISLGVSANYFRSRMRVNKIPTEYSKVSSDVNFGIYLNISNLPLLPPDFSFQSNVTFVDLVYSYFPHENMPIYYRGEFCSVKYVQVPFVLKYSFLRKDFKPYASLGAVVNMRYSYKFLNSYNIDYITKHYSYQLGLRSYQLGFSPSIGFEYITPINFGIDFGVDYELCPRFFNTYPRDETINNNLRFRLSFFYRLKKEKRII